MDILELLVGNLAHLRGVYLKDLGYIPDDKFDAVPMGAAKSPKNITLECAGGYRILCKLIDGGEAKHSSPEDRKAWYATFATIEAVKSEYGTAMDELIAKVKALDPAELDRPATAPWGEPCPLGRLIFFMGVSHTTYHNGQINYIQSLYGDDKFHWME